MCVAIFSNGLRRPNPQRPIKIEMAQKKAACIFCYGVDGKSGKAGVPSLGDRSYEVLVESMQRIRDTYC